MSEVTSRKFVNDTDIHSAALTVIAEYGIDDLGMPQVAEVLGVTPAPLYRRFDSADDIVADLWSSVLRPHMVRCLRATLSWKTSPSETEWLKHEIVNPSIETQALIETLSVSRRLGIAGTSIRSDFEHDLNELIVTSTHLPPILVIASVTPLFGSWLLGPFSSAIPQATANKYADFAEHYSHSEHWALSSAHLPYVPPSPLHWSTGEPALDDLRMAAVQVVAKVGVSNTTTNRIMRCAGRSVNTAYRRLGSKNDLVVDAVDMALNSEFGFSGNETAKSMPLNRPDRIARSLQVLRNHIDDRNLTHRAFLLEVLLAGRHNSDIRVSVANWFNVVTKRFDSGTAAFGDSKGALLMDIWRFRIAGGIGSLLTSLVSSQIVSRYDPMPAISANDQVMAKILLIND